MCLQSILACDLHLVCKMRTNCCQGAPKVCSIFGKYEMYNVVQIRGFCNSKAINFRPKTLKILPFIGFAIFENIHKNIFSHVEKNNSRDLSLFSYTFPRELPNPARGIHLMYLLSWCCNLPWNLVAELETQPSWFRAIFVFLGQSRQMLVWFFQLSQEGFLPHNILLVSQMQQAWCNRWI